MQVSGNLDQLRRLVVKSKRNGYLLTCVGYISFDMAG
jgi:hypothetical protein